MVTRQWLNTHGVRTRVCSGGRTPLSTCLFPDRAFFHPPGTVRCGSRDLFANVPRLPRRQTRHGVHRECSLVVLSPVLVFELGEPLFSLGIDQEVPQGQPTI